MATFYSHIIQYVGTHILGILTLVIFQTCINNLFLLSLTQPFLDTVPRPPACHVNMPQQTFSSFISNVTRHPPGLDSYFISLQGYHPMPPSWPKIKPRYSLLPYFKSLAFFLRSSSTSLRLAFFTASIFFQAY